MRKGKLRGEEEKREDTAGKGEKIVEQERGRGQEEGGRRGN